MATVTTTYLNWISANNRGIMAHLYQFTYANGSPQDYFTDFDTDVVYGGITYKSNSLRFEGLQRKLACGFGVDEQTLKIWASPTDTLFGINFLAGVEEGILDGAIVVRSRIIWPFFTGNAAWDVAHNAPVAVWTLFTGYIANIVKGGTSHIEMKVKSPLTKLNVNMPRNYYQPGCNWTLYSNGCTLVKSAFAVTGAVASGLTQTVIPVSGGIGTVTGADGLPEYAQGRLLFTSGALNNLQVLIDANDATNLYLAYPLTTLPNVGDSITFYPGCGKTYNTCNLKFNNKNNFRGFDRVPPVMISI